MKQLKLLLIIFFTGSALLLQAQRVIYLHGGANLQQFRGKDALGNDLDNSLTPGFTAGLRHELALMKGLFLQSGLSYTTKGSKDEFTILTTTGEAKVRLGYLEVPINLMFFPYGIDWRFVFGAGPYFGYAINGKMKGGLDEFSVAFKSEVNQDDREDVFYFKRADYGVNALIGYKNFNGWSFYLNAQMGLAGINADYTALPGDKTSFKNMGYSLSMCIPFLHVGKYD